MAVIDLGRVTAEIDDTLTKKGTAADAAAVGEALGRLETEIGKGGSLTKTGYTLAFPASGWIEQPDGSFTQQTAADGVLASDTAYVDVNMTDVTMDNYSDIVDAWGMVARAQTQDGGLLLTAYDGAPEVDLAVKMEVFR